MKKEYDFSKGVRAKYYKRFCQGSNLVKLDPDIIKRFSSSRAINQVLRSIIDAVDLAKDKKKRA
ncbi:MAG: hypothetical protein IT291_05635 [Deltaproteobacteria bacterium]|nr:hypothetical protein [Deltaproteobacteria bacterium]